MKPSAQSNKSMSSTAKSKKNSKDREKRKSQATVAEVNNHNSPEKCSPSKDSSARLYAGIDSESLVIYGEQCGVDQLSEDVSNTLSEDINYRLRFIINDALIKARLTGRNVISSSDLEEIFENLSLYKIYGAPTQPNWIPFGNQNLSYLDDQQVNLVELAIEESVFVQYGETIITKHWLPEQKEVSKSLKNYFTAMCQIIVNNNFSVTAMGLRHISINTQIGPVTEWFYNFGYILLSKDITYDCLTLRALDLISALEANPVCRFNVTEKQLRLLVRLILQRLLKTTTTKEVLKPICRVLAILCEREPLKEFVISKVSQKLPEICQVYALPIISIANSLGVEAVKTMILPNQNLFLTRIIQTSEPDLAYSILETYYTLYRECAIDIDIYKAFYEVLGDVIIMFNLPFISQTQVPEQVDMNFSYVRRQLIFTRRKVIPATRNGVKRPITEVFDMPANGTKLQKLLTNHKWDDNRLINTSVIIGKTSLLSVFREKKLNFHSSKCCDHTLLSLNL